MIFWKKLRMWRRRRQFEADLEEEIRIHREMSGETAFGSVALALEDSREVWGLAWLDSWKQDIRYAFRGLRRSPAFALGVIGAIGLGIGLNTTMFTLFNAYALRPFSVRDPYSLYSISWYGKTGNGHWFSWQQFQDLRARKMPFSDSFASLGFPAQVGSSRTYFGQPVSGNYFQMLGAPMAQGRPLAPDDSGPVVVLSDEAWRNAFAADPQILGRTIYLRGQPFQVVGVTSPAFAGLEIMPVGFWIPLRAASAVIDGADPFGPEAQPAFRIVGRLQPGIGVDAAKSALLAWSRGFAPEAVGVSMLERATSIPLTRDAVLTFLPLFIAFALILVIACANVSNMMLARALARQREIAIRISLGAARWRLIRQLLTESVLLALPAAAAGFGISESTLAGARRLLFATAPPAIVRFLAIEDLSPDWRVFGFILAASVVTAMLFGLVPAIQTTRSRLVQANRGDFSSDYRPARMRNLLVVAQVAVCSLLLICTAIVLRSEGRVTARPLDLDTRGVWDVRTISRHQQAVVDRLFGEPGVEAVAAAWQAPLFGSPRHIQVVPSGTKAAVGFSYNLVSSAYFSVFRIPLLRGRLFTEAESQAEAPVALVGESVARQFWPRQDAIGQTMSLPPPEKPSDPMFTRRPPFSTARIIGVVADRMSGLAGNGTEEICVYFPTHAGIVGNWSVLVRLREPAGARRELEAVLDRVAPGVADFLVPMDDVYALQIYPFRVTSWVAGFLAAVALLMTLSGIYGVMSYLVSQRTKEIGIRVALGAAAWDVLRMVLRQSAWLAGIGTAGGIVMALLVAPVFAHQMEAIQPYDWAPYAAAAGVVLAAAMAASYSPARRAVAIDPVRSLRCD